MSGEWWIINREAVYADGSIGDIGHAGHVRDYYRDMLRDYLGVSCDAAIEPDAFARWLTEHEVEGADVAGDYDDPLAKFLQAHRAEDGACCRQLPQWATDYKNFKDGVFFAVNSKSDVAVVEHAIRELRWVRVVGNNIQCMDYAQMGEIVDGLFDIDEDSKDSDNYYIEILSTCETRECTMGEMTELQPRPHHATTRT